VAFGDHELCSQPETAPILDEPRPICERDIDETGEIDIPGLRGPLLELVGGRDQIWYQVLSTLACVSMSFEF
jgi:hypothetical protein